MEFYFPTEETTFKELCERLDGKSVQFEGCYTNIYNAKVVDGKLVLYLEDWGRFWDEENDYEEVKGGLTFTEDDFLTGEDAQFDGSCGLISVYLKNDTVCMEIRAVLLDSPKEFREEDYCYYIRFNTKDLEAFDGYLGYESPYDDSYKPVRTGDETVIRVPYDACPILDIASVLSDKKVKDKILEVWDFQHVYYKKGSGRSLKIFQGAKDQTV